MSKASDILERSAEATRQAFFPRTIEVPDCLHHMLAFIYPTVNWKRVVFHEGWPHAINVLPYVGITLPDTYLPGVSRIYIRCGSWDPCICQGLSLIVHEGYHILQLQDSLGGWGLGLVRPFVVRYLACLAANRFAYADHPMEVAAFVVAGRRTSLFEQLCLEDRLPCDCSLGSPIVDAERWETFLAECQQLVQRSSRSDNKSRFVECTPGLGLILETARQLIATGSDSPQKRVIRPFAVGSAAVLFLLAGLIHIVWMLLWTLATVFLWVSKIAVEAIGILTVGILQAASAIVSLVES